MCLYPSTNACYPPLICFPSLRVALAAPFCSQGKYTPLHWASLYGHAEMAKVLLAAGANIHASSDVSRENLFFLWGGGGKLSVVHVSEECFLCPPPPLFFSTMYSSYILFCLSHCESCFSLRRMLGGASLSFYL
jgi:hypothetical protein